MKPVVLAPLVALALAAGGAGAYLWLTSGGSTAEAAVAQPTATEAPTLTPTAEPPPTPAVQTYRNEKYGYEVSYPEGWRLASAYMEKFAEVSSDPSITLVSEDVPVLTSVTEAAQRQFVEKASQEIGIALSPWFRFALGHSIRIRYSSQSRVAFLEDVHQGGLIVETTEIREELLDSGQSAIRVTRRRADDNGDYTYDAVYISFSSGACPPVGPDRLPCQAVIFEIVKTPDYAIEQFEAIFRSFREGK